MSLVSISRALSKEVDALTFSAPAAFVYNPLDYARVPHENYLKTWGAKFEATKTAKHPRAILLGMNPGPFGMMQIGVPFGEINLARDFLHIDGKVNTPERMHPKRPIEGWTCKRSEVSGKRLWSWAQTRFETPERFFESFFVWNYCPLAFLSETGSNVTPDKIKKSEMTRVFEACDEALRKLTQELEPTHLIGVGAFAQAQAERAFANGFSDGRTNKPQIGQILHPSPASPKANRGWAEEAEKMLRAQGFADVVPS